MDARLFEGCRRKIERALEHEESIRTLSDETFTGQQKRPRLAIRRTHAVDEYVVYIDYMPELADLFDRVGLILGDAIHNLRSALDHLTFQLAVAYTGGALQHEARIQFPIAATSIEFQKAQRRLAEVSPVHVKTIESFQPYSGYRWWDSGTYYSEQLGGEFHPLAMLRR